MRSRKVEPGAAVMRTTIQSETTSVPPVTALRSPPDSRITGADSPVTAASFTLAGPPDRMKAFAPKSAMRGEAVRVILSRPRRASEPSASPSCTPGFSAGGTTALIAVGGTPDFGLVEPLCKSHPEFVCQLQKPGVPMRVPAATEWTHDARISAAVVVAPGYGFTFEPDGLSAVRARVQLWEGSLDASLPLATNAGAVRRLLPQPPEFHLVDNADHFSFLTPCGAAGLLLPKMLCADPDGFDRTAFHAQFNAAVVAFFNESLREPAGEQNVSGSDEPPAH